MSFLMFPPSPQRLRRAGLPLHVSAISVWRDKACSFADFSTKGGNCTAHGGRFFLNTKPLQTLAEMRVGRLFVKYVLLTSTLKTGHFYHRPYHGFIYLIRFYPAPSK
jgi:hypothetical protein